MQEEQINIPWSKRTLFSSVSPSNFLVILEGLFELTWRASRALDTLRVLLPELLRNKDTIRCTAQEGPRTGSATSDAADCAFVEKALLFAVSKIGRGPGPP